MATSNHILILCKGQLVFFIWIHIRPELFERLCRLVPPCVVFFVCVWLACPQPIISLCSIMWMHVHMYICAYDRLGTIGDRRSSWLESKLKKENKPAAGRGRVNLGVSSSLVSYLLHCAPVQERKLRVHRLRSNKFQPVCAFCVFCFQMSYVFLSIWPAAREQWLMVDIRIETSLLGDNILSQTLCLFFCLFIFVFFLTVTLPHTLSHSLFFFYPHDSFLKMYGPHIPQLHTRPIHPIVHSVKWSFIGIMFWSKKILANEVQIFTIYTAH